MYVGIICPSAAGSGVDCVVTMEARKLARMDPYKDELAAAAIDYRPFAISCWGRLHPNARQMLISLAKRIARREGSHSYQQVLTRLEARISALIWRRAA